jgi:hypothetical protein
LNNNLKVDIPDSPDIYAGDYLELYIYGIGLGDRYTVTDTDKDNAANNPDFRYALEIDKALFPDEGTTLTFPLDYYVGTANVDGTLSLLPIQVTIDREPPGGIPMPYLGFTPDQILNGIGADDLTGDFLQVRAPLWYGKKEGDIFTPWHGTSETEGALLEDQSITVVVPTDAIFARFPKALLLANDGSTQYFGYKLVDGLGNESEVSRKRAIDVSLSQARHQQKKPRFKKLSRFPKHRNAKTGTLALPALRLPDGVLPTGVIPISQLEQAIPITIANVPGEFQSDWVIQLFRIAENGQCTPLGEAHSITAEEATDSTVVFTLIIPLADIPTTGTTAWTLDYSTFDPLSGGGPLSGLPVTVIIDREAPGGIDPSGIPWLEFSPDQLSGITLADVVGGGVPAVIPSWYDQKIGDVVTLWIGPTANEADGTFLANTVEVRTVGVGLNVAFLVTDLETLTYTPVFFSFHITDEAGNTSAFAFPISIEVLLRDAPTNLQAPIVPDYDNHGVVTQKDAFELVEVEIPPYDNALPGDRIYVIWGATTMPPESIPTPLPTAPDPLLVVRLPYALVISEGSGNRKQVSYQVWRGALNADTSPPTTVDVNLDSPGPGPDPDPSTPWHENLQPLIVKGASNGADNIIPPGDFNLPATATIPHLGLDSANIWLAGDRVQTSWNGVLVGTAVPITTANVNTDITITIPASIVGSTTGLLDVFYVVSRDILPGTEVATAESRPTQVEVQSPGLLPGNGTLVRAVFPEENTVLNVVNRTTGGLDGTPVRIPLETAPGVPVANITKGDFISLKFVGRTSLTDPAAPEITASEFVVTDHVINDDDIRAGYYEVNIPYNANLQLICRNGATLDYSMRNTVPTPVTGAQKFIRIVLDQPGEIGQCFIPPHGTRNAADTHPRKA